MFRELLIKEFSPYASLSSEQLSLTEAHYDLLVRWNSRMNLTRIESLEEMVTLHYCESFFVGQALPQGVFRVVDIGSGPGFPGVPVAILRPELEVTLLESNKRKCVFLRESTRGLKNVRVLESRIEDCKDVFDWGIARAVAPAEVLASKIARNFALAVSATDAIPNSEVTALPWGSNRVLSVSRET